MLTDMTLTRYYAELDQLKAELDKLHFSEENHNYFFEDKWWKSSFCNSHSLESVGAYVKKLTKNQRLTSRGRNRENAEKSSQFVPLGDVTDYIRKYNDRKLIKYTSDYLSIGSAFSCDTSNHTDNQYKSPIKTKNCVLEIPEIEEIQ
ncbi:unnamed protein product [Hymenolepis diminuta]|uniref:Uncharacterized protein n=1 Tax=Hymenolepis diminuta TaxID=6216 RepID=A0A564YA60_HYMDI|nr:unnamed protein product [Hymenolepis diminuta]